MGIKYRKGYKYQLAKQYQVGVGIFYKDHAIVTDFIELSPHGILTIKAGYAWDGPSGPTIDTKTFMRGSLVHDALYQLMRMGLIPQSYRSTADNLLHMHCREDGMARWRAWYVYKSVKRFAASAAKTKNAKKVYIAP